MIKTRMTFLEGRLFFSQSGLFENFSDCSDWMDKIVLIGWIKAGPQKSNFWSCKQANSDQRIRHESSMEVRRDLEMPSKLSKSVQLSEIYNRYHCKTKILCYFCDICTNLATEFCNWCIFMRRC